ncbi:unnamed protein product [Pleuronectes platessa]|uniref:Uncharacterized protein n=1 Tax=Pleuronectes platessa TaxID=8262 RepID=A0A9N7YQN1_PLEPL|nr:unnamed protein product [Pleuronectes platessa]
MLDMLIATIYSRRRRQRHTSDRERSRESRTRKAGRRLERCRQRDVPSSTSDCERKCAIHSDACTPLPGNVRVESGVVLITDCSADEFQNFVYRLIACTLRVQDGRSPLYEIVGVLLGSQMRRGRTPSGLQYHK